MLLTELPHDMLLHIKTFLGREGGNSDMYAMLQLIPVCTQLRDIFSHDSWWIWHYFRLRKPGGRRPVPILSSKHVVEVTTRCMPAHYAHNIIHDSFSAVPAAPEGRFTFTWRQRYPWESVADYTQKVGEGSTEWRCRHLDHYDHVGFNETDSEHLRYPRGRCKDACANTYMEHLGIPWPANNWEELKEEAAILMQRYLESKDRSERYLALYDSRKFLYEKPKLTYSKCQLRKVMRYTPPPPQ